ncbi:MAG TPA: hypothetical protein VF510_24695, partial [Ktedonobacterales bacterium]
MNTQQYCPHCGSPVEGGSERCRTCGAAVVALPLSPSSEASQLAETSSSDRSNSATPFVVSTPPATTPIASPAAGYDAASQGNESKSAAPAPPTSMPTGVPPYVPGGYGYPSLAQGGYGSPQPAPTYGWPAYGYPANPYSYNPYGGYGYGYPAYPYAYPWSYYPYSYYVPRRRPPNETYALVVSWVVTVAGGLSVICGLLVALLLMRTISRGDGDNLVTAGNYLGFFLAPLVGGAIALYYG